MLRVACVCVIAKPARQKQYRSAFTTVAMTPCHADPMCLVLAVTRPCIAVIALLPAVPDGEGSRFRCCRRWPLLLVTLLRCVHHLRVRTLDTSSAIGQPLCSAWFIHA